MTSVDLPDQGSKQSYRVGADRARNDDELDHVEPPFGRVANGYEADLIAVDGNPLENIRLLANPARNIKLIMQGGRIVKDETLH